MEAYLDHNSTTPLDARVLQAMMPFLTNDFGNPSSAHSRGARALQAVEQARQQVADLVDADANSVYFCASATEAINTIFSSVMSGRVVTSAVEHASSLRASERLELKGIPVLRLRVNRDGQLDTTILSHELESPTALVSVLWANNETGTIFPIQRIAEICSGKGVPLHLDAVQAAGKLPISLRDIDIDFISISAHKFNGPKGVAALVANNSAFLKPLIVGGPQERGQRAGTENVAGIVGFGKAAELARIELHSRVRHVEALRNRLESALLTALPGCWINGDRTHRLSNTTNIGFPKKDADDVVARLSARGIFVSSGSACNAQSIEPSHVIQAMGRSFDEARSSVRFSLSHTNTAAEIDLAIDAVVSEFATE